MGEIMTVAAGEPAVRQIKLAYDAGLPVLLHGRHGVGKSELMRAAAAASLRLTSMSSVGRIV